MLRYFTAGETHGPSVIAVIEGMPAGVFVDIERINNALSRRQAGYGRGGRMSIEQDKAKILSGIRGGYTLGSPISVMIENRDWKNWERIMGAFEATDEKAVYTPRPGHADLAGAMKYAHSDMRNVLERASARETAARVAAGAICCELLREFSIKSYTRCVSIGEVKDNAKDPDDEFYKKAGSSPVGFGDAASEERAKKYIDEMKSKGESVGGVVETVYKNVPPGLGSYAQYDRKLDANIAFAAMSIQAVKGVEIGIGFGAANYPGSYVHDEIEYKNGAFLRKTNNAGGIEGGMSNGEPIVVRAAMKPIPTLYSPLKTVDINTKEEKSASVERSDICAVPACSVVLESVVGFEIAKAFLEKFGGDCLFDIKEAYNAYIRRISDI